MKTRLRILVILLAALLIQCQKAALLTLKSSSQSNDPAATMSGNFMPNGVVSKLPSFSAITGTSVPGSIQLSIAFPPDTSSYAGVIILRKAGSEPPKEDCSNENTLVVKYLPPFKDTQQLDIIEGGEGKTYSYRVCVYATNGFLASQLVAPGVVAKDNGDSLQPPNVVAVAGKELGTVQLTLTYPADTSNYKSVSIRRSLGTVPPSDCVSGDLVATLNIFQSGNYIDTSTGWSTTNPVVSYRVCITSIRDKTYSGTISSVSSGPNAYVVFVTSLTFSGNLGGITGADQKCAAAAAAAKLPNAGWRAIISGKNRNFAQVPLLPIKVVQMDPVFSPVIDLAVTGSMFSTQWMQGVTYSEKRALVPLVNKAIPTWSGMNSDGSPSDTNCNEWQTNDNNTSGISGNTFSPQRSFARSGSGSCDQANHLTCLSK